MRPDPVWTIFRRRTFSRLAYWCLALGYDFRDRSLTNRFYFAYFLLFWAAWAVAVFALLGSNLAGQLDTLPASGLPGLAARLAGGALAAWGLVQLWQVGGRSPFVFGEPDAYLLCQTPVSRRRVGLAWLLMDWFGTVLPFAAGAVLFAFTLSEAARPGDFDLRYLLTYFAASLRALAVVLPLQLGLQAGLWGLGALRLRRDRARSGPPWLRLALLPVLLAAILPGGPQAALAALAFPLQAAFDGSLAPSAWLLREAAALLVLGAGLAALLGWSGGMHLGRAARETRLLAAVRLARSARNEELAAALRHQARMRPTRPPSRLPARGGAWVLAWKGLVQAGRGLRLDLLLRWLWVFGLGLGIGLARPWTVQLLAGAFWAVALGGLAVGRLRSDLARWWLLRSLPLRTGRLLLAELGPACGLGLALGWLGLALSAPPPAFGWPAAALLPFVVANAALGTAGDILDHARARLLMTPALAEENVPRQDIQGVLTVLATAGLPLGLLAWGASRPGGLAWGLLALPAAAAIAALLAGSVRSAYRRIE